jgi:hypothetical protein
MDVCQYIFARDQSEQLANCCRQLYDMLSKHYDHIICFRKDNRTIFRFPFRGTIFNIMVRYDSRGKVGIKLVVNKIICYANTVEELHQFLQTYQLPSEFWRLYYILDTSLILTLCTWHYDDNGDQVVIFYNRYKESDSIVMMTMTPTISYRIKVQVNNKYILYTTNAIYDIVKILND